uniref:Rho guanine nucleotide exchange factor 26 isoform X1 n=1 Tax=Petromyzon marinus TaxID=7757 RepID=A0AAJ7TIE8_PETMA|nr:rho guanine nucleotide exchange factor 26 isoform X1 [Petromyzon marinus]XP_032817978.1 rho guanine nucleotide exchange factor 26 isoform X1 [Petromyzon marinus]XP_032817979.1 rho guanine nucleotide exchange factor 26 isoform X1 [Petromyzon marinus]
MERSNDVDLSQLHISPKWNSPHGRHRSQSLLSSSSSASACGGSVVSSSSGSESPTSPGTPVETDPTDAAPLARSPSRATPRPPASGCSPLAGPAPALNGAAPRCRGASAARPTSGLRGGPLEFDVDSVVLSTDSAAARKLGTAQVIPKGLAAGKPAGANAFARRGLSHHRSLQAVDRRERRTRSLLFAEAAPSASDDEGAASAGDAEAAPAEEPGSRRPDDGAGGGAVGDVGGLQRGLRSTSYRRAVSSASAGGKASAEGKVGWLKPLGEDAAHSPAKASDSKKLSLKKSHTFEECADTVLYQQFRERGLDGGAADEDGGPPGSPEQGGGPSPTAVGSSCPLPAAAVDSDPSIVPTYRPQRVMWSQLPEVGDSGVLERLSSEERKRQEAMFEIITSEHSYLHSLEVLIRVFLESADLRITMTKTEQHHLFSNITDVRDASRRFFTDLEARHQENVLVHSVSDIVERHAKRFDAYVKYCTNEVYQQRTLASLLAKNTTFKETLGRLEAQPDCGGLSMTSFLILPMQRVTRLPLIMDTICQKTNKFSIESERVKRALKAVSKLVKECNDGARKMERTEEMFTLQKQLEFRIKPFPLVSASRWLVKRGELTSLGGDGGLFTRRKQSLTLLLFNDVLIVTRKRGEEAYLVTDYGLGQHLMVDSDDDDQPAAQQQQQPQASAPGAAGESGTAGGAVGPSPSGGAPAAATASNPRSSLMLLRQGSLANFFQVVIARNHAGERVELNLLADSPSERARWVSALRRWKRENEDSEHSESAERKDLTQVEMIRTYMAVQPDELSLQMADVVLVYKKTADGWYEGERLRDGERGWFPAACAQEITCHAAIQRNMQRMGRLLGLETNV